jgi:hypothetical protein
VNAPRLAQRHVVLTRHADDAESRGVRGLGNRHRSHSRHPALSVLLYSSRVRVSGAGSLSRDLALLCGALLRRQSRIADIDGPLLRGSKPSAILDLGCVHLLLL